MSDEQALREGQIVTGPVFDEPMRVETVGPAEEKQLLEAMLLAVPR